MPNGDFPGERLGFMVDLAGHAFGPSPVQAISRDLELCAALPADPAESEAPTRGRSDHFGRTESPSKSRPLLRLTCAPLVPAAFSWPTVALVPEASVPAAMSLYWIRTRWLVLS